MLPGPTMSEGVETFVKDLARQNGQSEAEAAANFVKQHRPSSLLQRFASVEEIANMVVYVASKEAAATNGAAHARRRRHRRYHRLRSGDVGLCDFRSRGRAMPAAMEAYRSARRARSIAQYGGRYLVRGGAAEAGRGRPAAEDAHHRRVSVDGARCANGTPRRQYAEALKVRQPTRWSRRLIFVEGVAPAL